MKKLILFISFITLFNSCDSDDDNACQGIDCLPPITQNGAGTFGCLVNGEPFVDNSGNFNCFYQLVDGEYFFNISAQFESSIQGIGIGSLNISIEESSSYSLVEVGSNNFSADVFIDAQNNFETQSSNPGRIVVNKLDLNSNIVSATFEFTVTNSETGMIYQVTNGRFDTVFTR
ncbi:hypothetical protein BST97_10885 [Nonlabens spongiae]|uniref:Uncharacterized protein n=1 Tax=Nonlabens spongiae TaxID=331648 RepID=A0A1W6MLH8_9FLAO|nr:hypothetical protein [Nonlabens spongiae]ARN78450.1 hypothetical protein BST97_10885 [Nonlabens spongiae]